MPLPQANKFWSILGNTLNLIRTKKYCYQMGDFLRTHEYFFDTRKNTFLMSFKSVKKKYFENYLSASVRQTGLVMHPIILIIQVVPQRDVMVVVLRGALLRILLVKVKN